MGDRYYVTGCYYSIVSKNGTKSPYHPLSEEDAWKLGSSLSKGFVVFYGDPYRITCWTEESSHYTYEDTKDEEVYYDLESITFEEYFQEIGDFKESYLGETDIVIKEIVNQIGEHSFAYRKDLRSIVLPNSAKKIGKGAFKGCYNLKKIVIPHSVETIEDFAFDNCSSLETIVIPDSVTRIGQCAFANCSSLTNVVLSKSLERIENSVFHGCTALTDIVFPKSVKIIGSNAFRCSGLTNISLPNSVTEILGDAFYNCTALEFVLLPWSLKRIAGGAFEGCSSLASIEIPASVYSIDGKAFNYCPELKHIKVSEDNRSYYSPNNCNAIISRGGDRGDSLVCGCSTTVIPSSVKRILNYAFRGCTTLKSIEIPDSVTTIYESAFVDCTGLTSIVISDSVREIKAFAFDNCINLKQIRIGMIAYKAYGRRFPKDAKIELIDSYRYRYLDMESHKSVVPDSPMEPLIGEVGCFNGGVKYMVLSIDKERTETATNHGRDYYTLVKLGKIHSVPPYTIVVHDRSTCSIVGFTGAETKVEIPWKLDRKMVVAINADVFQNNSTIEVVQIPQLVSELGAWFFQDCSNLTSVTIPNSVKKIGPYAFEGCSKLSRISIGSNAYERCKSSLPEGVEIQLLTDPPVLHQWQKGGSKSKRLVQNMIRKIKAFFRKAKKQ